jgi:hypothetical protein
MGRPKIWENDAERKRAYRAANPGLDKRQRKRPEHDNRKRVRPGKGRVTREFITIDGEALGETGYHLLAASTGDSIENREKGLSSLECLQFLLDLKAKHGIAIYCGFALGYDCEHWIRDFGPSLWLQFRDNHGEGQVRIGTREYTLCYIPRKWFKIGYYIGERFIPIIEVYDLFTFFQTNFVSVVGSSQDGWGAATPDEMKILVEWKERRGEFAVADWDAICEYNQIECRVLVRLANKLRDALEAADIHLRSWHGPGAVANFLLKRYNMSEHIAETPPEVTDAIGRAYFGGRFQVFRFGHIEGVNDYDISSAYPFATTLLPSTQGRWERVDAYQGDDAPWTVYLVSWHTQAGAGDLTPFPWRTEDGQIHYPAYGHGWYWGWEVAAARRRWRSIRVEDGWRLYPTEEGVFGWMNDLAAKRVEAKQQAKTTCGEERERWQGIARAYKLALNSVYGKTIQTVGLHRPFLCPMWAGLITSYTRAKLMVAAQDVTRKNPGALVCFATDGLFSTATIAGRLLGKSLGDWEEAATDIRLELYQSGCYAIYKDGEQLDSRFRGVSRNDVPWDDLRVLWKRDGYGGKMPVPTKRFIGHRTALQSSNPSLQCTWKRDDHIVDLMPGNGVPQGCRNDVTWYSALPYRDYNVVSARYRKLPYGDTEQAQDEENVQP